MSVAAPSRLVVVGVDEAGYGPVLGPLCVSRVVMSAPIPDAEASAGFEQPPDLWRVLRAAVCKEPRQLLRARKPRIAVNDSKRLKQGGEEPSLSLRHLERGVLAALRCAGGRAATDLELFRQLGAAVGEQPWYAGPPRPLPMCDDEPTLAIRANALAACMASAGVRIESLAVRTLCEKGVNDGLHRLQSKASVSFECVHDLLAEVWRRWRCGDMGECRVVVTLDRQGGRTDYAEALASAFDGAAIEEMTRSASRCEYVLRETDGRPLAFRVVVTPKADEGRFEVALASMCAKYVRDLMMLRFNDHWCARLPELKPTLGYAQDARRWLRDAEPVMRAGERREVVRLR